MTGKLIMLAGETWERARVLFLRRVESTPAEQIEYVRYSAGGEMLALRNGDQIIIGSLRSLRSVRGCSLDVVEVEHELTDEQRAAILPCFAVTGGTVIVGDREPTVPVKSFEVAWEGSMELGNFLAELYRQAILADAPKPCTCGKRGRPCYGCSVAQPSDTES